MDPTLKVKNESANEITLGRGDAALIIAAGGEQELPAALLQTRAFSDRLATAELRFVMTPNPNADQVALARRIFPSLLRALGPRFLGLRRRLEGSVAHLERKRQEYNHSWTQTEFLLREAGKSADAASNVANSARRFAVHANLEKAAEDALLEELDELRETDPSTIDDLPAFLARVREKEAELSVARTTREAAEARHVAPYQDITDRLLAAAQRFQDADPDADIGEPTPPFP